MSEAPILVLEEQVRSLSDELMQCQADKEFVWSLWKRLQVSNPDLTQAVSLVVEREKYKAETKDRKVLEILQSKDYTIQELEQTVAGQQQEIYSLLQKRTSVDEESGQIKEEVLALREQLVNKRHELEEMKTQRRKKEEEELQVVQAPEEEKEGLSSRCVALQADLEDKERQANSWQDQKDAAQARVLELEKKLHNTLQELSTLQNHSSSMANELASKDREWAAKEAQLCQLRCDFAELQIQYRQSTEHAAEQNQLIQQLEGLNLDTQKVMRIQEEAHTADTTSCQKLYKELSQSYQAIVSSEANLRQGHQEVSNQLAQKDQHILQIQTQLQQQQEQIQLQQQQQHHQQQAQHTAPFSSSNRQTNVKDAPVQRSRSLSPANNERGRGAEQRIKDLEELLQLKAEEHEELRRAHDNCRQRFCLIQTNYKTVKHQLKMMEKSDIGRMQRADPWQLRQDHSDTVWNDLAYWKNLSRKLSDKNLSGYAIDMHCLIFRSP